MGWGTVGWGVGGVRGGRGRVGCGGGGVGCGGGRVGRRVVCVCLGGGGRGGVVGWVLGVTRR